VLDGVSGMVDYEAAADGGGTGVEITERVRTRLAPWVGQIRSMLKSFREYAWYGQTERCRQMKFIFKIVAGFTALLFAAVFR
jgi:hypothetical protein